MHLRTVQHARFTSKTRGDMADGAKPCISIHYAGAGTASRVVTSLTEHDLGPILEERRVPLGAPPVRRVVRTIALTALRVRELGPVSCSP
jgi:hypothetical protein